MIVTVQQIMNEFTYVYIRHGNKGYPRDEQGNVIMRGPDLTEEPHHLGYTWTYRCHECPRLTLTHHIMHPDKPDWRVWAVDGEDVIDIGAACVALSRPPLLTMAEFWAWYRMGPEPLARDHALDVIAGCVNETPNFIDGPWATASRLLERLQAKDMVRYRNLTDTYQRVQT